MVEELKRNKVFGGLQVRYKHASSELRCQAVFSVFYPPASSTPAAGAPLVVWLSGLTCTDENFVTKAGAQRAAARLGLAIVAPDTSPRGLGFPGEDDSYDFGTGAGFYVDATAEPWKDGYRMRSYVADELPSVLASLPPVGAGGASDYATLDLSKTSILGHSMGGHGALTLALSSPGRYRSASAFSPIVNPTAVPWGRKALAGYLGDDEATWARYDAVELAKAYEGEPVDVLIDQGTGDEFLHTQLQPEKFEEAVRGRPIGLTLRLQDGYDHSYFFIASFIDDHLEFHARHLGA